MTTRLIPLLAAAALAGPAAGQTPGKLPATGTEVVRFALHLHGVNPLSDPQEALADPAHTLVVVIGARGIEQVFTPLQLRDFVNAGGAVLIASDEAAGGRADWASALGIRITGNTLTADRDRCYQGLEGRPFVRPRARVGWGVASPFDLFNGVADAGPTAVATDRPSEMAIRAPAGYVVKNLAGYAEGARRRADDQPVPADFNYFALSLEPALGWKPGGRMIVLADREVLANGMMGFRRDGQAPRGYSLDNGNWEFANRTIDWLQGGGGEPRSHGLFVQDGRVIDRFAVSLPNQKPPIPDIPADVLANLLLNAANPIIQEAEKRDVFNRFLENLFGFPRLVRLFVIAVTALFLFACLRRLLRGQRKADPAAVLTAPAQAALLPRGGVLRQRTASQLEVGNLYEAARRRVRERFDVLGGRPGPLGHMPAVLTAIDLPDGPLLHQSVRWLWSLGYGDTPIAVPPTDWDRTNLLLERVTTRARRGDWSFAPDAG